MDEVRIDHLTTEAQNPATRDLDRLTTREIVGCMADEDRIAVDAVHTQLDAIAAAVDLVAERLATGGRLVYVGAGTSGRLGVVDASECPPTFNVPDGLVVGLIAGGPSAFLKAVEGAEDDPAGGARDLQQIGLTARDVVVGIAASGRTPYVLGALGHARGVGAATIGFSCNAGSDVERAADLAITPVVGPEVLSGSTRLKAGTATKLVLNMLTTGAMVRLGKSFGNLMVDVQATNKKLVVRSKRIVAQATGRSVDEAETLLAQCDGEVKTAIVAALRAVDPQRARDLLLAHGGRVRAAVEDPRG